MNASTRTFLSLGSLLVVIGCGTNGNPSAGGGAPAATTPGTAPGPASQPGCSTNPACGSCASCYEACVCQTGDATNCKGACPGSGGPTTPPAVDPASQAGCTTAPACGSCTTCYASCFCQTGDATQCTATCSTTGAGGAGGGGAAGTGGAVSGQGGSGSSGAPGAGGAASLPPSDTWTTASNLDANGKLIAPATGEGFQISTPVFDLNPGDEVFKCFHVALPNTAEFDVGQWESQMTEGSHHFILYKNDGDTAPSGQLDSSGCTLGFGGPTWLYTSGTPHSELPMPDGVAMPIPAGQRVVFDMHYINLTQDVIHANVTLNMNKVKAAQFEKAQALVSFNTGIFIPPNGTQTVGGDCTPGPGAKFFIMGTHTHRRGVDASITRVGGAGEVLVHTTNWDSPTPGIWETPPYLTFAPGEKFHYSCTYQNDRAAYTTVGASAANNEMCMAITYYFPASAGGTCN